MRGDKYATVEMVVKRQSGASPFPIDMLRYDSCVPAGEPQANLIAATLDGEPMPSMWNGTIILRRFYPVGGSPEPNRQRWERFGWKVVALYQPGEMP